MKHRAWDIAFGLLFLYAAIVQYNDPDLWRWIGIYVGAAIPCFLPRVRWFLPAIVGAIAFVWMCSSLPEIFRERAFRGTEIEREAFGLLIVAVYMLLLAERKRRA